MIDEISPKYKTARRVIVAVCIAMLAIGAISAIRIWYLGIGVLGENNTVSWGINIVNFVWWVGIGHAGTFISAALLLLNQSWRKPLARIAETATICSIICAAGFPLIHLGRPYFSYYLIPFSSRSIINNSLSPLFWDVLAIGTYFTISVLFWMLSIQPDAWLLTQRKDSKLQWLYHFFAGGWNTKSWKTHKSLLKKMAFVAVPLVISVHTIVSFDFACTNMPGWHETLFPPYFVIGALFSGFAMVQLLYIATYKFALDKEPESRVLEPLNKMILACSLAIAMAYYYEFFDIMAHGTAIDKEHYLHRLQSFPFVYAVLYIGNVFAPLLLSFKRARASHICSTAVSILVLAGMWAERYSIVIGSLSNAFIPARHAQYAPTFDEIALFVGSAGFFVILMATIFSVIPIIEMPKPIASQKLNKGVISET